MIRAKELRRAANLGSAMPTPRVHARRCASDNYDGIEYKFEGPCDVRAVLEEIETWPDKYAVEHASTSETGEFFVFVAEIEKPRGGVTFAP